MTLGERLERMEPRERQLLGVLVAVFATFLLLAVPVGATALLAGKRAEIEEYRAAIAAIHEGRGKVKDRQAEKDAVTSRYANPAPPLAGYLAKLAKDHGVEIPESQDRADVPHGKRYNERSTKLVLKKVPLLNLTMFLEAIAQSQHPVVVSRLNLRKRGTEPDSYDVELLVSAFDRSEVAKPEEGASEATP